MEPAIDVAQLGPQAQRILDPKAPGPMRQMAARGIAPSLADVRAAWSTSIDEILGEATLARPKDLPYSWYGKRGEHSEHLGYILSDMQYLQRAHPGARW